MNKKDFDNIIRTNLKLQDCDTSFGYGISGRKPYENYYSNDSFIDFCLEMKENYEDAYKAYSDGAGSELKERNSRYGKLPPKMASVGSSSRFCYLALRDGATALGGMGKVAFEYGCKIDNVDGMAPQLDAIIKDELIFIEVKCHEIFDSHTVTLKKKYWQMIYGSNNQFGLTPMNDCGDDVFEVPLSVFGIDKKSTMFDIKQLLCHLLGVASTMGSDRPKKLIYLFFKPISNPNHNEIDKVFDDLKWEIDTIFTSKPIINFCRTNKIELQAFAEESDIMMALTKDNIIELHV